MDLVMPNCDGVEVIKQLVQTGSRTFVLVLTTYSDEEWVYAALRAGARGFLTKDAGAEWIRRAIVSVAAGNVEFEPGVQRRLLDAFATGAPISIAPVPSAAAADPTPAGLTTRELEVLSLIAAGLSNSELAERLSVSEATVKTHVNHLLGKTRQRDRAQLVGYAYRHGVTFG